VIVVDASVWVSGLVHTDINHRESRRWLDEQLAAPRQLYSPTLLLPEVAGAIVRRTGRPRLAQQALADLGGLMGFGLVLESVDDALAGESAGLAIDLGLRGSDAVYVAVARRYGFPLVSWDREQRERAAAVVEVASPVDDLFASR
jgi:predicted nucleic acid-binding protein